MIGSRSFTLVRLNRQPLRCSRCRILNNLLLPSAYRLFVWLFAVLQGIKRAYGERSVKGNLASKALDGALAEAFGVMSTGAGRRLTSQLVVGPALAETLAVGGRRLCESFLSFFPFHSFFDASFFS